MAFYAPYRVTNFSGEPGTVVWWQSADGVNLWRGTDYWIDEGL